MGSIYEKLVSSVNPPIPRRSSSNPNNKKTRRAAKEARGPSYYDKAGLEPMFTRIDPDLAYSDEEFRIKSNQLPIVQKSSEVGKLGISTNGMAETLNQGEREKDFIKQDMGVPQKHKNVDID
jgi:hypothetical protein